MFLIKDYKSLIKIIISLIARVVKYFYFITLYIHYLHYSIDFSFRLASFRPILCFIKLC